MSDQPPLDGFASIRKRRISARQGGTIVEYAIFGALICAAMFFAGEQWSHEAQRTFRFVGGAIGSDHVAAAQAGRKRVEESDWGMSRVNVVRQWTGTAILTVAVCAWLVDRIGKRRSAAATAALAAESLRPLPDSAQVARNRYAEKRLQILNAFLKDNHKLLPSDMRVGDLMSQELKIAASRSSVAEVRKLLEENNVRHVLICDADRRLVGVVSDRDLKDVDDLTAVDKIMAARPTTVTSDSLVNNAITMLLHGRFSSLPVVDGDRLVGILTTTDVVMTLQCAMLAVEQIVVDLRTHRDSGELETLVS